MVEATTHNRLSHYSPTTGVLSNSCALQLKVLILFASFTVQTPIPNGCFLQHSSITSASRISKNVEYTMHLPMRLQYTISNTFTIEEHKHQHIIWGVSLIHSAMIFVSDRTGEVSSTILPTSNLTILTAHPGLWRQFRLDIWLFTPPVVEAFPDHRWLHLWWRYLLTTGDFRAQNLVY